MACSSSHRCRLSVVLIAALTAVTVTACGSTPHGARSRPKTHFLSWESVNAKDSVRAWRRVARPERHFEVAKRRTVRLKKPSVWNRKPVQFATPVVAGERLFVGSNAGMFYGIDIGDNSKIWSIQTQGGIESPAFALDDSVYVGDIKGYAYSFDVSSGRINWSVPLGNEVLGAPLVTADRVYLVTLDGRLFALDRSTGGDLWHTDAMERSTGFTVRRQSSPVLYNRSIIFGTSRGTLVAYNDDGTLKWVRFLAGPQSQVMDVDSRPLIVEGSLYASSADGTLFCLDPADGEIRWSTGAGGVNDAIYHGGVLYAAGGGKVAAVDPVTGALRWEQDLDTPEISSPAGGKGFVAVVTTSDKFYLIDKINGDILFERYVRRGSYGDPVMVDDMLYILANTGRLFSFRISEKEKRVSTSTATKGRADVNSAVPESADE